MKKHVSELPIDTILRTVQKATQQAAINAVKAGRNVYGRAENLSNTDLMLYLYHKNCGVNYELGNGIDSNVRYHFLWGNSDEQFCCLAILARQKKRNQSVKIR